jgi:hypothetical protein
VEHGALQLERDPVVKKVWRKEISFSPHFVPFSWIALCSTLHPNFQYGTCISSHILLLPSFTLQMMATLYTETLELLQQVMQQNTESQSYKLIFKLYHVKINNSGIVLNVQKHFAVVCFTVLSEH